MVNQNFTGKRKFLCETQYFYSCMCKKKGWMKVVGEE